MDARQAVEKAIAFRNNVVGKRPGTRVEEVEGDYSAMNWFVTLSWLEEDERNSRAKRAIPLLNNVIPQRKRLERVYHIFNIEDNKTTMKIADWFVQMQHSFGLA